MKYNYVLFDADETLFRFDIKAGLVHLLKQYQIQCTDAHFDHYQKTNKRLWLEYQDGIIDAELLQIERFTHWGEQLDVTAKQLNDEYLDAMAKICAPLPGALTMLNELTSHAKLGIITNGLERMQQIRLKKCGVEHLFDWLVISEVVGITKPNVGIFNHTLELMGNPPRNEVLMVGDNATSDVLGGMNAGIDTCWLQHPGEELPDGIQPTYQINNLSQLTNVLAL